MEFTKMLLGIIGPCCFSEYTDATILSWAVPSIPTPNGEGSISTNIPENWRLNRQFPIAPLRAVTDGSVKSYTLKPPVVNGVTLSVDTVEAEMAGYLKIVSGSLDYETNPTVVVIIEAVDDTPSTGTATVTLTVDDVDEPPVFQNEISGFVVCNTSGIGTIVGRMTATDPESNAIQYNLRDTTEPVFAIDATSGVISVNMTLQNAGYLLEIDASDGVFTGYAKAYVIISTSCSGVAVLVVSMATILVAALAAWLK